MNTLFITLFIPSNVQLLNDLSLSTSLNFDNAYASVDSYILRHIYENNPLQTGLTLELFKEGHLKLILPFNVYDKNSLNNDYESLIYYDYYICNVQSNLITSKEYEATGDVFLFDYDNQNRLVKVYLNEHYNPIYEYEYNEMSLISAIKDNTNNKIKYYSYDLYIFSKPCILSRL